MTDIKCPCGTIFCFKCLRETHRPCDCFMIELCEKKSKKDNDAENLKWLLANTKQCPNCHKYIEKNQGCNHMTCRKEAGGCGYEFCWICLGAWAPHGTSWYECKRINKKELEKSTKKIKDMCVFHPLAAGSTSISAPVNVYVTAKWTINGDQRVNSGCNVIVAPGVILV